MTGIPPSALADLLRAFAKLSPEDDETRQAVAVLLGAEPLPAAPGGRPLEVVNRVTPPTTTGPVEPPPADPPTPTSDPSEAEPVREEIAATLIRAAQSRPDWLVTVDPFPEPTDGAAPPVPDPLLLPQWTRAILGGALATLAEWGPLDIERLALQTARGVLLLRLPRRPWPTLARGVQVLVDKSDRMLLFSTDQTRLVEQIRAVAGRENTEVLFFDGLPAWGAGAGSRRLWNGYYEHHVPKRGTTVVLLSDLGLGPFSTGSRLAGTADWRRFAERMGRSGCPVLAFVPCGAARWPAELRTALHLLHWDRSTSPRTVRSSIGRALRVPGKQSA